MFTAYTYQDWEREPDKIGFSRAVVSAYTGSKEFRDMLSASRYFRGENDEVAKKVVLRASTFERSDESGRKKVGITADEVVGNRIGNNFFFRFITQQNMRLLSFGVTLEEKSKEKLGNHFDNMLAKCGENALVQGVCWGFWNFDHLEIIPAAKDAGSGMVALLDEMSSEPRVAIQFWRLSDRRPLYIRIFEEDGVAIYTVSDKGETIEIQPKQAYRQVIRRDAIGETVIGGENWNMLPVIPLYGNPEHRSELSPTIKAKIDAYDRILSDFGDNLDRANDVYWVLNNFGGSVKEIAETLEQIHKLKAVANQSDGVSGGSTAEPHTIEVPYAARQTALVLLERALYADFMALNMDLLTGGSLTNVAIKAAMTDANLKTDRYEWEAFDFVRKILLLNGIDTDEISFKRQNISNDAEIVQSIYLMRGDIDRETALKLNPYIQDDMIDGIMKNLDAEEHTGVSSLEALEKQLATAVE